MVDFLARLFAEYLRTSTADQQSPEDSRRWQHDVARRLVEPHGGQIVETYHDTDTSREVPWCRREHGAQLLRDLADPNRGWNALVIAEPQRAFSGGQFSLVFPQLTHFGVELWVPELGGRVDPDSEGHEMLMGLFGGLSKAERRRLQTRVRGAVLAHGAAGRWLGGRANYGYVTVDTDMPHPQRQKASAGIKLRTMVPDPATAPVVRRIFEMFDQGIGYRSIANILEREGLPSPGEIGPTRHPRSNGIWAGSAVRAILTNQRYLGHQVVGRLRRRDELIEPMNPAMGTKSRQHWQPTDTWVTSDDPAWPALVDRDLWERVNERITNYRGPARKPARSEPGRYLLSGLVRCGACGRSMHGAFMRGKPYYRCNVARPDYAKIDHPPTTAFREERILGALDEWLGRFTDEQHRQTALASLIDSDREPEPEPADVENARRAVVQLQIELDRVMASIRAGMDPDLVSNTARGIQREMAQAQARITAWEAAHPGTATIAEEEIAAALEHAGGLAALVSGADREPRARLYRALGLDLLLDPVGDFPTIRASLQLCGGGGRT